MTYSTQTAPAAFGASIANFATSVGASIAAFFATLGRAMVVNSTAQLRLEQVGRLEAKTDAELAALGIDRARIVHHVFRDLY